MLDPSGLKTQAMAAMEAAMWVKAATAEKMAPSWFPCILKLAVAARTWVT
jgi:hypothetical protein